MKTLKAVVPEGMLESAMDGFYDSDSFKQRPFNRDSLALSLASALIWFDERLEELRRKPYASNDDYNEAIEDVRQIFTAPETEVPEAIKDLLDDVTTPLHLRCILEAYHRGQESKVETK